MSAGIAIGQRVSALRGATLADGSRVDVHLDDTGRVATVHPAVDPARCGPTELDLRGSVLLASAVEPHAHLDKALSWAGSDAPYGDLRSAILSWRRHAAGLTEREIHTRARRAAARYLAGGFTAVRSHVDMLVDNPDPLCAVRALVALREELRGVLDLQVCLLSSYLATTGTVEAAVAEGVDVLGGCPHLAEDPTAEVTRLLDLAERTGLPVDLHTDEQLNPGARSIVELARQSRARGLGPRVGQGRRVTASHCVSLGTLGDGELDGVLDEVAAAGLGVVTLPVTNLYLQARHARRPTPRGIAPVRELLAAGVTVAAGADNLRDPFNPMGRADPFETTSLLVTAAHLDADEALHAITVAGRELLGLPAAGPVPGALADLVAVEADEVTDVLAGAGGTRHVLRRGRLVARTTVTRETALDLSTTPLGSPT